MSTKSLGILALFLLVLVAVVAALGWSRLGHGNGTRAVELRFHNTVLEAEKGDMVDIRPLQTNRPTLKLMIYGIDENPDPGVENFHDEPHFIVVKMFEDPRAKGWRYVPGDPRGPLLLAGLGNLDHQAWLRQIEVVRDTDAGGTTRRVVCATFGHPKGMLYRYFYDPERPVRPVGWYRMAVMQPDGTTELYFASNAN